MPAFTFNPSIISFASASVVAGGVSFPVNAIDPPPSYAFPKANGRQIVILNTGATTLYFGNRFADSWSTVPPPFNPAGVGIVPTLGGNCTVIPAGGTLTVQLDTFEKRGSFDPYAFYQNQVDFTPCNIIFFSAPPATNATAQITYINTNGPF